MQTASCFVRLLNSNGPHKNEAFKAPVTPAEVVILRSIHGDDAVVHLKPLGMDKREHRAELDRLRYEYGPAVVTAAFPGHSPTLPVRFADVGIELAGDDSDEDDQADKQRKAEEKAAKAAAKAAKAAAKGAAGTGAAGGDPADAGAGGDAGDGKYDPAIDGE